MPFQIAAAFGDPDHYLRAWQSLFDDICNTCMHAPWQEVIRKGCAPRCSTNDIKYKMN